MLLIKAGQNGSTDCSTRYLGTMLIRLRVGRKWGKSWVLVRRPCGGGGGGGGFYSYCAGAYLLRWMWEVQSGMWQIQPGMWKVVTPCLFLALAGTDVVGPSAHEALGGARGTGSAIVG